MPAGPQSGHWLRRNDTVWTPPRVIFLDSETRTEGSGQTETEVLRCWAAQLVRRRDRRRAGQVSWADGETQDQAAAAIDRWCSEEKTTWLYAHNVGFDLVTTRLAQNLAVHGWQLSSRFGLSSNAPWCVLHKGRREVRPHLGERDDPAAPPRVKWDHTLTITDSFSLLPVALEQISAYTAADKPPLPAQDDSPAAWMARCRADVAVLAQAVLDVMDWWEDNEAGRWAVTGPACGWASYRHTIQTGDVLISGDPDVLAVEHAACYGGRRDVFKVGSLPRGRYAEIDFTAAYPTIAANVPLPRKVMGRLTPGMAEAILSGRCPYGMIAEAEITTDRPRWPLRSLGRVFYPVGTFRTVLAGPDIAAAHARGQLVSIGAGWFYSMSGHMAPWARWVLGLLNAPEGQVKGPVRIAAKNWSRAVIGKTAQRGWRTTSWPGPPSDDWAYEEAFIAGSDHRASITGLAGDYWLSVADQDGSHEFPAILAYVEAHVRQRLNDVIEHAPAGAVIQCDTDGLMADCNALADPLWLPPPPPGGWRPARPAAEQMAEAWSELSDPLVMRVKSQYREVIMYGPQHAVLDGRARLAGVPASAWQAGDGRWCARLWPGLSWQMTQGSGRGYDRPVQPYLVTGPYAQGWVLDSGAVVPVEAHVGGGGHTHLLAWPLTRWARAGARLAADQSAWTEGLRGE